MPGKKEDDFHKEAFSQALESARQRHEAGQSFDGALIMVDPTGSNGAQFCTKLLVRTGRSEPDAKEDIAQSIKAASQENKPPVISAWLDTQAVRAIMPALGMDAASTDEWVRMFEPESGDMRVAMICGDLIWLTLVPPFPPPEE